MKKKWRLMGLATLAICGSVAVAIPALQPAGPGVTEANRDRIEFGMVEADVENILGRPADHSGGFGAIAEKQWVRRDGAFVEVTFANGTVIRSEWCESSETIPDKLQRWLSLPRK